VTKLSDREDRVSDEIWEEAARHNDEKAPAAQHGIDSTSPQDGGVPAKAELEKERKTAAITGGAQGIGRRVAEVLAERGYRLALNDLRMPDETVQSIRSRGGEAIGYAGNVADEAFVEHFVRSVYDAWGRADVLVNNAGVSFIAPAESISGADYRRVLEVNLVAPFLMAKAFGSKMLAARRGCIVNVASVAGLVGIADRAAYNASKHGLRPGRLRQNGAAEEYA
jgi:NAD(P)-dependent dehydrogenase (short-subunit alcohol dehydrogenase family)